MSGKGDWARGQEDLEGSWPSKEARTALDGMSDHFVALDRSFVVTFVNRAFAESRSEGAPTLIGRNLWEIWPEMRGSVVETSLAQALELQLPVAFEYHHERSGRWLSATAHPHDDRIHVFFRDVTEARRNEAERTEREARLQAMVDSMPQIAWATDARMVVTHLNRRWREYTGIEGASPEEVAAIVHSDDLPALERLSERAAALGESLEGEARLRRADGRYRLHLVRMAPLVDPEGGVAGWIGTSTDVHNVRAADLRLAAIADAVPAFVGFLDADRVYRFVNRTYEAWFGRPKADVVGRSIVDVLGESAYQRVRAHLDRALAGERADFAHWFDYPVGRRFVRGAYVPLYGEDGRIEGVTVTVVDETAIRVAEERLRESESRLRAIFDHAAVGMLELDPGTYEILSANPAAARTFGHPLESLRGRSPYDFAYPEDADVGREDAARVSRGELEAAEYERRSVREDGRVVWLFVRVTRVPSGPDGAARNLAVVTDVTARKAAEASLRRSESRWRFLARLSDALRARRDASEIAFEACALIAEELGLSRCTYTEVDLEVDTARTLAEFARVSPSLLGAHRPSEYGAEVWARSVRGEVIVMEDAADDPLAAGSRGVYESIGTRAFVHAPLLRDRKLEAFLDAHSARPRAWSRGEVALIKSAASRVWEAVQRSRAEAALREANARLETLAATDFLTGLWNARVFHERLEEEWAESRRSGRPLSLALLDLDDFKGYNDAFGHPAGDEALRRVAAIVRNEARRYDVAARLGGEEFALLMPGTDAEQAQKAAERVRAAVAGWRWPLRAVTTSVGVATMEAEMERPQALYLAADRALYGAKGGGRNRVARASESGPS